MPRGHTRAPSLTRPCSLIGAYCNTRWKIYLDNYQAHFSAWLTYEPGVALQWQRCVSTRTAAAVAAAAESRS